MLLNKCKRAFAICLNLNKLNWTKMSWLELSSILCSVVVRQYEGQQQNILMLLISIFCIHTHKKKTSGTTGEWISSTFHFIHFTCFPYKMVNFVFIFYDEKDCRTSNMQIERVSFYFFFVTSPSYWIAFAILSSKHF